MTVGIYGIFDAKDDTCLYVGLSSNIEDRWAGHIKRLNNGRHLRKDFVVWFENQGKNINSLRFEVLEECEAVDSIMNLLEIKWFNKLGPRFYGKAPGLNEKWSHSTETKAKISMSLAKSSDRLIDRKLICSFCGFNFHSVKKDAQYCSQSCASGPYKATDSHNEKIVEMYEAGKTLREIGPCVGMSYRTVKRKLDAMGISRNS